MLTIPLVGVTDVQSLSTMTDGDVVEKFLYLTTLGRTSGRPREIELWFVERGGHLFVLAEHGFDADWVKNLLKTPTVTVKLGNQTWDAVSRVLDADADGGLFRAVRQLANDKYGWGDGLPVELRRTNVVPATGH